MPPSRRSLTNVGASLTIPGRRLSASEAAGPAVSAHTRQDRAAGQNHDPRRLYTPAAPSEIGNVIGTAHRRALGPDQCRRAVHPAAASSHGGQPGQRGQWSPAGSSTRTAWLIQLGGLHIRDHLDRLDHANCQGGQPGRDGHLPRRFDSERGFTRRTLAAERLSPDLRSGGCHAQNGRRS
jgi:hypothetical protein